MTPPRSRTLLTLPEAAERLRLSERFVRTEIYRGALKAMKAGPSRNAPIRISEEALADYIKQQAFKAKAKTKTKAAAS